MCIYKEKQSQSPTTTVLTMNSEVVENYKWSDIYAALKEKNKDCQNENTLRLFYYASLIFKQAARTNESDDFIFYNKQGKKVQQRFRFNELFKECAEKNPTTESEQGTTSDMYNFGVKLNNKGKNIINLGYVRYDLTKNNVSKFTEIFNRYENLFDVTVQKLLSQKILFHKNLIANYSIIDVLGGYFLYEEYKRQ